MNEINITTFSVEKSTDGVSFHPLGNIDVSTTANSIHQYQYTDASVQSSKQYHRLRIIEKNGSYNFSEIITLSVVKDYSIKIFPNPLQGNQLYIQLNNVPKDIYTISIINYAGRVVLTKEVKHSSGDLLTNLLTDTKVPSGNYLLNVQGSGGFNIGTKLIKNQ